MTKRGHWVLLLVSTLSIGFAYWWQQSWWAYVEFPDGRMAMGELPWWIQFVESAIAGCVGGACTMGVASLTTWAWRPLGPILLIIGAVVIGLAFLRRQIAIYEFVDLAFAVKDSSDPVLRAASERANTEFSFTLAGGLLIVAVGAVITMVLRRKVSSTPTTSPS